jgi:hypothetical protein
VQYYFKLDRRIDRRPAGRLSALFAARRSVDPRQREGHMANPGGQELHVCAGLNACAGHGKSGDNTCAGTGDCATAINDDCHGNNQCRGQGGCGGGGSLGSQQTAPGDNLCRSKGSCNVPATGIDANTRIMKAAGAHHAVPGIYEGRHVWQVARMLFEQRMMASGRTFTNNSNLLGPKTPSADSNSAAKADYLYFGPPKKGMELGPGTTAATQPDRPLYYKPS